MKNSFTSSSIFFMAVSSDISGGMGDGLSSTELSESGDAASAGSAVSTGLDRGCNKRRLRCGSTATKRCEFFFCKFNSTYSIHFAAASPVSTFWLESMENIFELDAVLEIDSFLISFFLPAKTLLGPKVIG